MDARSRHARVWLAGGFLAAASAACSLQNFDYLTHDQGVTDAAAQEASTPDATSGGDASTQTDASEASDAIESDARDEADASQPPHDAATHTDASIDAPVGDSGPINYIVNPNFAASTLAGWTIDPSTAAQNRYVFTQPPQGSAVTPQGQPYELATYSGTDAFTVDVSQTLTVPDGVYTFSAWFNLGTNNQVYIYAKNCGGVVSDAVPDGGDLVANVPVTSASGWEEISIPEITVKGGSCQVGLYVDAAATDWLNADGFSFELANAAGDGGTTDGGSDAKGD